MIRLTSITIQKHDIAFRTSAAVKTVSGSILPHRGIVAAESPPHHPG